MTSAYAQLLGRAQIRLGSAWIGFHPEKRYQLLAYLAYRGDWVSRDRLAYLFWSELPDKAARRNLRKLIFKARELLWLEGLEAAGLGLRWAVDTDVARFLKALDEQNWAEAVALYHGPLLAGMDKRESAEFADWLALERERLHERWREAVVQRAQELEGQGEHREAAALLHTLLEHDVFDEEALRAYMTALVRAGEQAQALVAYRSFAQKLMTELELEPGLETQQLARAIRAGDRAGLKHLVGRSPPPAHALPVVATPFIGRVTELAELVQLLAQPECRLLTLTGPGGVGKSRIVLQAAHELTRYYRDGAVFVSLEALNSPDFIAPKLAETLGCSLQGSEAPLAQVVRHLNERQMLLVLDNFEQLLGEAVGPASGKVAGASRQQPATTDGAALLAELLRACPHLTLLVTSRERLALAEEWLLPVTGLPFPPEGALSLEDALSFDAVALFVQRAKRVKPEFSLDFTGLPAVVEICRLIEGFPLGIELAAVWVRLMPVAEIAQEIQKNLDFLASSSRNLPKRQQSIRATFEHSWQLLTPKEQDALRKLSVFRGGFTREAARYVTDAPLPVLASLVDKSLLRVTPSGRYDRHPLLHQYTQEKLAERPEVQRTVQQRHVAYFFAFLEKHSQAFRSARQRQALELVEAELENVHLAWSRAVEARHVKGLARAAIPLARFYQIRGLWHEGVEALTEARTVFGPADGEGLADVLANQAMLHCCLGEVETTIALAQQGLALYARAGKMHKAAVCLNTLGIAYDDRGAYDQAKAYFEKALAIAEQSGDEDRVAALLSNLALVEFELGDYTSAREHNESLLEIYRMRQDANGLSITLSNLAELLLATGDGDAAEAALQEALAVAETAHVHYVIPQILLGLGTVHFRRQNYDQAHALFTRALHLSQEVGSLRREAESLERLGSVALKLGDLETAARHLRQALTMTREAGFEPALLSALARFAELQAQCEHASKAVTILGTVLAHASAPRWIKDDARCLLADLEHQLPLELTTDARKRGEALSLSETVEAVLQSVPPAQR